MDFSHPPAIQVSLVNKGLLVCADALTEDIIGPALVSKDDGHKNQCDDRHDRECVLRRGRIMDGETPFRIGAGDHYTREHEREERDLGQNDVQARHRKGPAFHLVINEIDRYKQGHHQSDRHDTGIDTDLGCDIRVDIGADCQKHYYGRGWNV